MARIDKSVWSVVSAKEQSQSDGSKKKEKKEGSLSQAYFGLNFFLTNFFIVRDTLHIDMFPVSARRELFKYLLFINLRPT